MLKTKTPENSKKLFKFQGFNTVYSQRIIYMILYLYYKIWLEATSKKEANAKHVKQKD